MTEAEGNSPAVEPMITAEEIFPALERRIAEARAQVALLFHVFDSRTMLFSEEARAIAPEGDWAALLAAVAARGVRVRVFVSDFDGLGAPGQRRQARLSLERLAKAARARGAEIEAIRACHPAQLGLFWRGLFAPVAWARRRAMRRGGYGDEDLSAGFFPRLRPATHHMKTALIDNSFALIGGLDIDERRRDETDHSRPAQDTWHDVSLVLRGAEAAAAEPMLATVWNDVIDGPVSTPPGLAPPSVWRAPDAQEGRIRFSLTRSLSAPGPFAYGAQTTDPGSERAMRQLIGEARKRIYCETQFFRDEGLARALARSAETYPDLKLTLVLPFAPQRFAFEGERGRTIRHAEWLQDRALSIIEAAFGDRLTVLSPAKPERADKADAYVAHGAGIVYVHAKVMIADSEVAFVGSANMNGRSLRWDTEINATWRDPDGVAAFERRLAEKWLGPEDFGDGPPDWRGAAERDANLPPDARKGFLLPHDRKRGKAFARRTFLIPDDMF